MNGKIDLHMHSNLSDGAYEPTELVRKAYDAGLSIISLTDHDSINGIKDAIMYGKELGVEVITGMEKFICLPILLILKMMSSPST